MRSKLSLSVLLALAVLTSVAMAGRGPARPGLDTSFGGDGKVTTRIGHPGKSSALATLIDGDGRTLVAGVGGPASGSSAVVVRFKRNGDRDGAFGEDGIVRLPFERGRATAMVERPDGGVWVAGSFDPRHVRGRSVFDFVVKLDRDGSLVPGFGDEGVLRLPYLEPPGRQAHVRLVETPDGRLVAAYAGKTGIRMVKISKSGEIDSAFGEGGSLGLSYGMKLGPGEDVGGLVVDGSGRVVASTCEQQDFRAIRFDQLGEPDPSFGSGGTVDLDPPGESYYVGCTLGSTPGEGVIGGPTAAQQSPGRFNSLVEVDRSGNLESRFGINGLVHLGRRQVARVGALQVLRDGDIALAATRGTRFATRHFAEVMLKPNGAFDTGFSRNGAVEAPFKLKPNEAFAIDVRNRVAVLAGISGHRERFPRDEGKQLIAVARFRN